MGTVIGVVIGYALGTRAGEDGWTEFYEAWKVIRSSEEVRDLVIGGLSVAKELIGRGAEQLAGALGDPGSKTALRPVA
jgi:hypothetical protein